MKIEGGIWRPLPKYRHHKEACFWGHYEDWKTDPEAAGLKRAPEGQHYSRAVSGKDLDLLDKKKKECEHLLSEDLWRSWLKVKEKYELPRIFEDLISYR